ncbi:response regulator transcription factor [Enterococcus sp. HY326]|uniref:response regulator transcription factor n=1 Tax=Enterococcus sp. HY326 TaxID=2971265 RepID=UPI00223F5727|nr:response regulator [Enterococcus sp. HY326]
MRLFIIDDQFAIRNHIMAIVKRLNISNLKLKEVTNEQTFYKQLESFEILDDDLFFLDIDLKTYFTGIDLAEKIRKKNQNCFIVFITAFDSKGIEVLNRGILPLGYLLKDEEDSLLAANIKENIGVAKLTQRGRKKNQRVLIFDNFENDIIIPENNIYYIATVPGSRRMLLIKHIQGEYMIKDQLSQLKTAIQGPNFYTGLKSFIINLELIKRVSISEGVIQFLDEDILEIGKLGARKIKNSLKGMEINGS